MIFVDTNVFMYLIRGDHPRRSEAQALVRRFARERRRLVTSSEVLQELLHRYMRSGQRDAVEAAFRVVGEIVDNVFSVREQDVMLAKDLIHAHPRLSARDAVHAAVMRRAHVSEILSFDRGFDLLPEIARVPQAG